MSNRRRGVTQGQMIVGEGVRSRFLAEGSSRRRYPLVVATVVAGLLAGCAVTPQPMTASDIQAQSAEDQALLFADQEIIAAPVTLEEALARALRYNLDYRLSMMEQALSQRQLELVRYDMLPRLAANAGWAGRSKEYLTTSRNTGTGDVAVFPAESIDKNRRTSDLGLSWNILDFGVSYYQAQQNADKVLIAHERRRKVVNQIVQAVRTSYWRAATIESIMSDVEPMLAEARSAQRDARRVEEQRLSPLPEVLRYQKDLASLVKQFEMLQQDLVIAKSELANLMGLSPGTDYSMQIPDPSELLVPSLDLDIERMEQLALQNRPELREAMYQQRITSLEARKAVLRMFPGVTFSTSANYDSNSYIVNSDWAEAGVRVSWNLMNLISAPANRRMLEAQADVDQMRRLALSAATLTQVHVGHQQFLRAQHGYRQAQELNRIEKKLYELGRDAGSVDAQSQLQQIQSRLSAVYAELEMYSNYAELQGATANLFVSVGLDLLPSDVLNQDLPSVRKEVERALLNLHMGRISAPAMTGEIRYQLGGGLAKTAAAP